MITEKTVIVASNASEEIQEQLYKLIRESNPRKRSEAREKLRIAFDTLQSELQKALLI